MVSKFSIASPSATTANSLGTLLRASRVRKGLTLQELATSAECAKSYLSQVVPGFRTGSGVSLALLGRLEAQLGLSENQLIFAAQWEATPGPVRRELARVEAGRRVAADQLRELLAGARGLNPAAPGAPDASTDVAAAGLDALHRSGRLRALIDRIAGDEPSGDSGIERAADSPDSPDCPDRPDSPAHASARRGLDSICIAVEVPLINSVAAGYPCDFTDLGYPARVADEYVRVPDVRDADAFAARVVGESMMPEYREGDIVVFSPARELKDGMDCFVRLEPDHQSTFKRIFFETKAPDASSPRLPSKTEEDLCGQLIRLQPLNPRFPAMVVPRERVAGLYAAVSVTRMV